MSKKYEFLSPQWETAAEKLTQELVGETVEAPAQIDIVINVTVTPTPFGDKELAIVSEQGKVSVLKQHEEDAQINVRSDYETAYKIFLGGDMNVILSAMLEGKIVVQGDLSRLLATAPNPGAMPSMPFSKELSDQLREITLAPNGLD